MSNAKSKIGEALAQTIVQQRAELRERAAVLVFEVREEMQAMTRTAIIVGSRPIVDMCIRLTDALVLLEAAGVPTPRLPTNQELER
ncbi:MAG: hypothetical protein L6Q35_00550 [Phycisphaerales bacterium]|nr:hypothetical protein [Phycisphaerales bacterium]